MQHSDVISPPPVSQAVAAHLLIGSEGGGIITAIRQCVPPMTEAGWDIRCIVLSEGKAAHMLRDGGLNPIVLTLGRAARYTQLGRRLRTLGVRLIHAHNPSAHLMGLRARGRDGAIVRTIHADMFEEMRGLLPAWKIAFWRWAMRYAYDRSDAVLTVSPHLIPLIPASDAARRRVLYLPNGFDPRAIENDTASLAPDLARWVGDAPLVLTMGRLVQVKNYVLLLEAWRRVAQHASRARLIIAGSGPLQGALEARIREFGLAESVLLLPWVDRIAPLIRRADVIAMSSLSECCPMLVLEAMAASKPLVATKVGGIPWMVTSGATAHLVPSEDAPALADALVHVLDDPQAAQVMGRAGRSALEEKFPVTAAARRTAVVYSRLLTGQPISQDDLR